MIDIRSRMKEHYYDIIRPIYPEDRVVGLFYYGSANYGVNTEFSDVDTKAIILPDFEDIAFNKAPASYTIHLNSGECIDVKDIRLYLPQFRKCSCNFVEILFTNYFVLNPAYATWWNQLLCIRESIAYYDPYKAIKAAGGMASRVNRITPKGKAEVLRIEEFISRYTTGEPYYKVLKSLKADYLKSVKTGDFVIDDDCVERASENIKQMIDDFTTLSMPHLLPKDKVDEIIDNVQYNIMYEGVVKKI